ncbi:hypothetical protein ABT91_11815 [Salmonella enterica subsp. enterica serovar Typhimurium]|nr:hypothetical protein ABT91_11815 [Salmonella enterica subsp. enterica serovar Typhimurium]
MMQQFLPTRYFDLEHQDLTPMRSCPDKARLEPMCLAEYLILDQEEWILISKLMMIPMMNAVRCYHAYLKMHTLKAGHSAD